MFVTQIAIIFASIAATIQIQTYDIHIHFQYLHRCFNIQGWWLLFVQILLDGHLTTIYTGGNLWKITRDGFARICWSCGKNRRLWKWSWCEKKTIKYIYIYKVSSQTRRFAVQNLRNNDSTPTNPSHIPLSAQVSFSPYYICSLSFPTQLFLSNHLSIFCFGSPFAPPSFPLSSQQVIEMPKKDSTSSDKGASFGGWKPPVVYREGRDMEAQWGWVFLKVQIEVIPWVECGCEEFMFLFLPLVRWWKGWTSVFLGRILRKVKCPNCCGHDISYIHHSKTPLMWQEKSPFVPVTLSRCW